jgi:hypothetical protein
MKKKLIMTIIVLGAFLFASCDSLVQSDPPSNLGFTPEELKADAATAGAKAGSFKAEGGSGALVYSLVAGSENYDKFTVEGSVLKLKQALAEGEYPFCARVKDEKDQSLAKDFTLTIGPAPPSGLTFTAAALKADTATAGAAAGSFSAESGSGSLSYSLVEGVEDYEKFTVEGDALKLKQALGEGEYVFRIRVKDGKDQSLEKDFILTVDPAEKSETPTEPDDPASQEPETPAEPDEPEIPVVPDVPGETETSPDEPEDPDNPSVPNLPETGEPGNPGTPGQPGMPEPGDPGTSGIPDQPDPIAKPPRVTNLTSSPGMQLVNLSWSPAARAASYEVYYSTDSNFASATKFALEPTEPKVIVTGLKYGKAYNFWVVAKNAGGSADESRMHTSDRTSDTVPDFLQAGMSLKQGKTAFYVASNLWPNGDRYGIRDLGESYPAHERYLFSYGSGSAGIGGDLYPGGSLKFVRNFNPPEDYDTAGPNSNSEGCLIYEFERTENGQRVKKYQATYYLNGHLTGELTDYQNFPSHPPAGVMGQANGHSSGMGDTQETYTLEEAIEKYAHLGTGVRGGGGRYDYFTMMRIFYGYNPAL